MATLLVLQGPDRGRTLDIPFEPAVLGRNSEQIPLNDNTVSRRHAKMWPANGSWMLQDLQSSNGTYVNGVRIREPIRLKHGDQIKIGSTLMVYGGEASVEKFSGAGGTRGLVDIDSAGRLLDSAILSSIPSSEDSVILAAPETADAVHAWRVMLQLSEAIGAILSPRQLLERVMDIIIEQVHVDRGFILSLDRETGELNPEVVRYRTRNGEVPEKITTSRTIINHVVHRKEGVICSNAMTDKRFAGTAKQGSIHNYRLHSVICVPIVARQELLGVIHIDCSSTSHTYTSEQLRLITAIGKTTGMAIENARLVQSHVETERLAATGETVAYLSHSIKNMLQALRGGADIVEAGLQKRSVDLLAKGWAIVQRNLTAVYNLSMNMLAFSKNREPKPVLAQLNQVVSDTVQMEQHLADTKQAVLLADLDDGLPPIHLDLDGIQQLMINLLSNAVDAVGTTGGRITVKTEYDAEQGEAMLSVSDNGEGIPPQNLKHIFEPFHSGKGHGGTGLGLAVAKKIVEEHNGRIVVTSRVGEGTTFEIALPTVRDAAVDSGETHGHEMGD